MRTKTLLFAAVLTAAALATPKAQGQSVSVNFVGYVNLTLADGFNLIANPLSNGDNTASTLFGDALPIGTTVFTWTGAGYAAETYVAAWPTNPELAPGSAFFVEIEAGMGPVDVTLVGEGALGTASNMTVDAGIQFLGSLVPQEGTPTALDFPFSSTQDVFFTWAGGFVPATHVGGVGFIDPEPTIGVGAGFIVDKGEPGDWNRDFSIE